ncbi:MAG: ABC transporter permease [Firmicutes bacterium]|nr:ABC transporter permease [Bacillota bacterium]
MKIRTVGYFFREAMLSVKRNGWMSLASVGTMAICLLVVGTALLLVLNTNRIVTSIESNIEIIAYLRTDTTVEKSVQLGKELRAMPEVAEVEFVSKEKALQTLTQKFGKEHNLIAALGGTNPLPDAFKIKAKNPAEVGDLAKKIEALPQVEKVRYGQEVVEKLFSLTRWLKLICVGIMVFLALAAVFLVATNIRLALFARRREIQIMKLVGATNWFIRWPFFLEGMFLGLVGAVIAVAILAGSYSVLIGHVRVTLAFLPLVTDPRLLWQVFGGLLAAGTILGAIGTVISLYRFLDV